MDEGVKAKLDDHERRITELEKQSYDDHDTIIRIEEKLCSLERRHDDHMKMHEVKSEHTINFRQGITIILIQIIIAFIIDYAWKKGLI